MELGHEVARFSLTSLKEELAAVVLVGLVPAALAFGSVGVCVGSLAGRSWPPSRASGASWATQLEHYTLLPLETSAAITAALVVFLAVAGLRARSRRGRDRG